MKNFLLALSLIVILLALSQASQNAYLTSIDTQNAVTEDDFDCFYDQGIKDFIAPIYQKGAVLSSGLNNLKNAVKSKVDCDVLIYGNTNQDASDIMKAIDKAVTRSLFQNVWIGVSSSEQWSDQNTNCKTLGTLISQAEYHYGDSAVSIYSTRSDWNTLFGSSCNEYTSLTLWYQNDNGVASFSDWDSVSFGGWKSPKMKQYQQNANLCNVTINFDYFDNTIEK